MITGKHLSRRTLLRGFGAAIALPALDAMCPAFAAGAARLGAKSPIRMTVAYVPNGIVMKDWTPAAEGADFEFTRILKPLEAYRDRLLVLSNLAQINGRPLGDGPGDHARAASTFLTGAHPRKTAGADISVGVSVDQVAAQGLGNQTRFASLELGCEDGRQVGNCDSGYSCAYSNSLSWRTPNAPNPPEINPRAVFERLFGTNTADDAASRAKRARYDKSILDFVLEDAHKLQGDLGATDRRKLDEYLTAVRDIERRISDSEKNNTDVVPTIDKPAGVPVDYSDHAHLMFDLQTIALQADLTRIITFMMGREGSNRTYREIGVPDAHHPITHHRNDPEMVEKVTKINCYHVEQFAYFLGKLKSIPEGDGTLLDHTIVLYGSGLSDGNRHTHHQLPVLVAGGSIAGFKSGRHVRYAPETPMNNLFLTILDRMGVPAHALGDANGELDRLSGV
jgi:hypothetical protein